MQPEISPPAEPLCHDCVFGPLLVGDANVMRFVITNSMMIMLVVMLGLIIVAFTVRRSLRTVPGGLQNFMEFLMEAVDGVVQPALGKHAARLFPLMASFFIFILFSNWFSLLPFVGTIGRIEEHGGHDVLIPWLRPATADMNMTLALALIAFLTIHVSGIMSHGPFGHLKELSQNLLLAPIFIVIELFVIVSLSFRLFGNLFAGEVLLGVASWILPIVGVGFFLLEVLFGLIQAIIFTMLTLSFTSVSIGTSEQHA